MSLAISQALREVRLWHRYRTKCLS